MPTHLGLLSNFYIRRLSRNARNSWPYRFVAGKREVASCLSNGRSTSW
ncbi:hypothetical protein CGRA01v4_05308 [Colletotrichum graminicola]|nr:hypothetical protein CGRA01v4_05308 [Colletotrichum graminicola]